jgi:D-3-phosphoglycerate dehydrogenase
LEQALDQDANIVNAEVLLRERGVELIEHKRAETGNFTSVVLAEVEGEKATRKAAATVFGVDLLRLVQVDDFRLDAYLDGVLMIFNHKDVPGIIGTVGTIFGQQGVNIAQMAVGRASKGGDALGVLNLDQPPPQAALEQVRGQSAIHSACVIKLPAAGDRPSWLA